MKLTGILILNAVLITLGLLFSGAYLIIDNLVEPTGNLFEGIVIFSLGTVMSMLLLVASALGKVIQTFTEINTQQIDIQQKVNDFYNRSKPRTIADIINSAAKDSITITNLDTGETTSQPISDPVATYLSDWMNLLAKNSKQGDDNLSNLSIEQLEKELASAVKRDDYERAQEIRDLIKNLRDDKKD